MHRKINLQLDSKIALTMLYEFSLQKKKTVDEIKSLQIQVDLIKCKNNNNIYLLIQMPSQIILKMNSVYPFGGCHQPHKQNQQILVRQQLKSQNEQNQQKLIQKAKHLKKLNIPHSIQITSIFQNSDLVQIYYEYVPVKFEIWMKTLSDDLYNSLLKQLYAFATFLALNRIRIDLNLQNLGFNQNYHIKYFIDIQNAFIQDSFSPSTLKEKYYREISLIVKNFDSNPDKDANKSLYFSLRSGQPQLSPVATRNSMKYFGRTPSLGNLQQNYKIYENLKKKKQNQFKDNPKKSALKTSQIIFQQKIQNIKQKLQIIKQSQPYISKMNQSSLQLQKANSNHSTSISRVTEIKKPTKSNTPLRSPSIEKFLKKFQKSKQTLKINRQRPSLEQSTIKQSNLLCLPAEDKINRSQRFRTPKNSQNPIEYLDICKSTQGYVQDFLNVLQDQSQEQDFQNNKQNISIKETTDSEQCVKWTITTQQSQTPCSKSSKQWKDRYMNAIKNSRMLINKMKYTSKSPQLIINR